MTKGLSRRGLIVVAGVAGAIYGVRALPRGRFPGGPLAYREIEGLAPFQTLRTQGQVSAASVVFVGLDPPDADSAARRAAADAVRSDLCRALFGGAADDRMVPIAYFSEFFWPYCRILERHLGAILAARGSDLRLVQHELPIFGPASKLAARASVAAARQGLQQPFRKRLMRSDLVAEDASIVALAETVGLDATLLLHDMQSASVAAELSESRALADVFGFIGTPGLAVGRAVISGAVPRATLERIIREERRLAPVRCDAS